MLVSLILNLNMTGGGTPSTGTATERRMGGAKKALPPIYDYDAEQKKIIEQEDGEVQFLIETILRNVYN